MNQSNLGCWNRVQKDRFKRNFNLVIDLPIS